MEKNKSNVIVFPRENLRQQPMTETDIANSVNMVKYNHVAETMSIIIPMLFNNIELAGFNIIPDEDEIDENIKDGSLLVESIRSLLCKYHGIKHPFQELAETVFLNQDDGTLLLNKKIEIELQQDESEEE